MVEFVLQNLMDRLILIKAFISNLSLLKYVLAILFIQKLFDQLCECLLLSLILHLLHF